MTSYSTIEIDDGIPIDLSEFQQKIAQILPKDAISPKITFSLGVRDCSGRGCGWPYMTIELAWDTPK